MWYNEMSESISKNNELENEMTLDMSYFWYSDAVHWQGPTPALDDSIGQVVSEYQK